MNVIQLEADRFDEIKLLFKNIFIKVPAYAFYKKNGFSELEGHVSLVKWVD